MEVPLKKEKKKIELLYDPEITLAGIYPEKNSSKGYIHHSVHCSTAYLANTWKHLKCPSTAMDKDVTHVKNGLLRSL